MVQLFPFCPLVIKMFEGVKLNFSAKLPEDVIFCFHLIQLFAMEIEKIAYRVLCNIIAFMKVISTEYLKQ